MPDLIGQPIEQYQILEQLGARTDLTCLIRAMTDENDGADMEFDGSDFRGDMSGLEELTGE